jgi:hypothetical protein
MVKIPETLRGVPQNPKPAREGSAGDFQKLIAKENELKNGFHTEFDSSTGTLKVTGTSRDDQVTITHSASTGKVVIRTFVPKVDNTTKHGQDEVKLNEVVKKIEINLGKGKNKLLVAADRPVEAFFREGDNEATIYAGPYGHTMHGGPGKNEVEVIDGDKTKHVELGPSDTFTTTRRPR